MDNDLITLLNEDGEEESFYIMGTFGLEDNSYAALLPVDDEEELIIILRMEEDDEGGVILMGIEDDDELEEAIDAYEELQNNRSNS